MLAASTINPEEREFVVDSEASMQMVSRKDLNSPKLETVRMCKNPTTVVTANGKVLTKEEATVHVRDLDLFVTVMLLEETPAFSHLENSAKITGILTIGRQTDKMQHGELRTKRCPWFNDRPFKLSRTYYPTSVRRKP